MSEELKKTDIKKIAVRGCLIVAGILFLIFLCRYNQIKKESLYDTEGRTFAKATVMNVLQDNETKDGIYIGRQLVKLKVTSGKWKGKTMEAEEAAKKSAEEKVIDVEAKDADSEEDGDSEVTLEEDEEEDVLLDEFDNEIDQWIIDKLKSIGCDTAKSVLAIDPEDLAKRADLDDETVEDVRRILSAEFE